MKPPNYSTHTHLTLLPPPGDSRPEHQIAEEWARGLEWVHWLLGSVRARREKIIFDGGDWRVFANGLFTKAVGPALEKAWAAAHGHDLEGILEADNDMQRVLTPDIANSSIQAGYVLLASTRKARYQGVLGHFREGIAAGHSPGHFAIVWAAVGHFFHLSLANVITEYLRVEWETGTRGQPRRREPDFGVLTSQLLLAGSYTPRRI